MRGSLEKLASKDSFSIDRLKFISYNLFMSDSNYSFSDLQDVFSLYDNFVTFNKESIEFIKNINVDNYSKYKKIKSRKQTKMDFNIFKVISDTWYRENFHSDVLKKILENREIFDSFIDIIKHDNIDINNYNEYSVEREKGRVDLAIVGDGHVIIIENKIFWACDQDEQLFRYYQYYKNDRKIEVDAIIYLSPNKDKTPSNNSLGLEKADDEDIDIANLIKKELLEILIGFDGTKKDLVSILENSIGSNKFFQDCDENKLNFYIFVKNYIDILKETGVGDMSVVEKKFLKEILESENNLELLEKAYFIREMVNSFTSARVEYYIENLGWGNNWDDYVFFNQYKKDAGTFVIDVVMSDYNTEIQLFSRNEEDSSKILPIIVDVLEKNKTSLGADWTRTKDNRIVKTFRFPEQDNIVIELVKKIHSIFKDIN